ncbi:MAG: FecR family protein [Prevotella sp.]|nr:FecR family protein [Prevotella sp.]
MEKHNINRLLTRLLLGKASEEERAELEKRANREDIQEILDADDLIERYEYYTEADVDQALSEMQKRMAQTYAETKIFTPRFYRMAAAVIALLIVGGAFWYHREYTRVTPPEISQEVQLAMEQSRQSGKQEALDERLKADEKAWSDMDGNSDKDNALSSKNSVTDYHYPVPSLQESLTKNQLLAARRIITKHDKEFWLTLDDGTLVHLNYNTRLVYPEKFGRGDRNVILDGEAYFMVAKDRSRPFIVHVPDGEIRVYGTEFNVNTRSSALETESSKYETTVVLVNGSISVSPTGGKEQMMKPHEQCRISNSLCVVEKNVDVEPYVAWNRGVFCFDNCTLEHLMKILSHWYGMNINFVSEETRHITFTGNLNKYSSIEPAIHAIHQVTGLRIEIKNNTIIIDKHNINP